MALRHKLIILFVLSSFYHFSFGQTMSVLSDTPFKSIHNINKIYHSTVLGETVFVLADIRDESGFIDVLLLKINKEGLIEKEITVGSGNASERPIGIFEKNERYYFVISRGASYNNSVRIYTLSKDLEINDVESIDIPNLLEGNSMIYNPNLDVITVSVTIQERITNHVYPHILEYDLGNKKVLSRLELNHLNDSTILKKRVKKEMKILKKVYGDNGEILRYDTITIAPEDYEMPKIQVSKVCNKLRFVDEELSQIAMVGFERTKNITDFWVAGIQNGRLYWEYIYEAELGGDEAHDVYHTEEELYIMGLNYNKRSFKAPYGNYGYKILVLDKRGKVKYKKLFRKEMRSIYRQGIQLGKDNFLMVGQAENLIYSENMLEEDNITLSNIWLVLVDSEGEQIGELYHKTKTVDKAWHMTKISEEEQWIFYTSDNKLKLLKININ